MDSRPTGISCVRGSWKRGADIDISNYERMRHGQGGKDRAGIRNIFGYTIAVIPTNHRRCFCHFCRKVKTISIVSDSFGGFWVKNMQDCLSRAPLLRDFCDHKGRQRSVSYGLGTPARTTVAYLLELTVVFEPLQYCRLFLERVNYGF